MHKQVMSDIQAATTKAKETHPSWDRRQAGHVEVLITGLRQLCQSGLGPKDKRFGCLKDQTSNQQQGLKPPTLNPPPLPPPPPSPQPHPSPTHQAALARLVRCSTVSGTRTCKLPNGRLLVDTQGQTPELLLGAEAPAMILTIDNHGGHADML